LPTAATASFEVDRYTAVGKNLHKRHMVVIKSAPAAEGLEDLGTARQCLLVEAWWNQLTVCVWQTHGR
jgi:hypothetical protein